MITNSTWPASLGVVLAIVFAWFISTNYTALYAWTCSQPVLTDLTIPLINGFRPIHSLCNQGRSHELDATATESTSLPECANTQEQARCQFQHVDNMNSKLLPLLHNLSQTAFFRYFKVNLYCDCPLWPDDGMCALQACSVCECDESEVPVAWLKEERGGAADDCTSSMAKVESLEAVDRSIPDSVKQRIVNLPGWKGLNNPWMPDHVPDDVDYSYINLVSNPERYTGYVGDHAHRIWDAIYSQNCFKNIHNGELCDPTQRVFYRIISGVHTSISGHIARDFLIDEDTDLWGPNLSVFKERMGYASKREHVENLYFVYLFVLKAVMKAAPTLRHVEYYTGLADEDLTAHNLMRDIVSNDAFERGCPLPFDAARMWKGHNGPVLKRQLQSHFQNITTIMDCVGCEKCKLWGKLQLLGVATSLKILFSSDNCDSLNPETQPALQLERNEVISLMNLLHRLSESIETYRVMSAELKRAEGVDRCCLESDPIFSDTW